MSVTAAARREALDYYGRLVQSSVLGLFLLMALYIRSSSKTSSRIQPRSQSIFGEPLQAINLVGLGILFCSIMGIWYVPQVVNPMLRQDYIYLTRLPVQLLASLLPFHVLLSNSSSLNLLPWLFGVSRASLVPYHRVLGWTFMLLFATHGSMYMNFYIKNNLLVKRIQDSDVQLGMALSGTFSAVAFASRKSFRAGIGKNWVWAHIAAATAIGILLWSHVVQTRNYVVQAGLVAAVGVGWRAIRSLNRENPKSSSLRQP